MNKDLFNLSAEIIGISAIISGLSNQLDNSATDTLTAEAMKDALFGISCYLDRIADDLMELDNSEVEKARAVL